MFFFSKKAKIWNPFYTSWIKSETFLSKKIFWIKTFIHSHFRIEYYQEGECQKSSKECQYLPDSSDYFYKIKVSNSGLRESSEGILDILLTVSSPSSFSLTQILAGEGETQKKLNFTFRKKSSPEESNYKLLFLTILYQSYTIIGISI